MKFVLVNKPVKVASRNLVRHTFSSKRVCNDPSTPLKSKEFCKLTSSDFLCKFLKSNVA